MKTKEDFEGAGYKLRPSEKQEIKILVDQLNRIVEEDQIDTTMLSILTNINAEINALRDKISWRIINLTKQGYKID